MQTTPYVIEEIEVGILETQMIRSVNMSRERFLEIVEQTLDNGEYSDAVSEELIPVAQTMPRFPFSAWINPERGCGCIVGEYLVATSEIDRYNLAIEFDVPMSDQFNTVSRLLSQNPLADQLQSFGGDIDEAIKNEIYHRGAVHVNGNDSRIYDKEDVDMVIDSVEIID